MKVMSVSISKKENIIRYELINITMEVGWEDRKTLASRKHGDSWTETGINYEKIFWN